MKTAINNFVDNNVLDQSDSDSSYAFMVSPGADAYRDVLFNMSADHIKFRDSSGEIVNLQEQFSPSSELFKIKEELNTLKFETVSETRFQELKDIMKFIMNYICDLDYRLKRFNYIDSLADLENKVKNLSHGDCSSSLSAKQKHLENI